MKKVCWPYFDPEFDKLSERIFGPACSVCIDNERLEDCTVVKVDSVNKQGVLLEVVQVLTDTNLTISKGFISSDARWFMDVFHVKDVHGNKLTDQSVIDYIKQAIGTTREAPNAEVCTTVEPEPHSKPKSNQMTSPKRSGPKPHREPIPIEMTVADRPGPKSHSAPKAIGMTLADRPARNCHSEPKSIGMTGPDRPDQKPHSVPKAIEMTGPDRPGLLSEISAALADLHCKIVEAHAWSHNARLACVAYISDQSTDTPIDDHRLASIEDYLTTVLRATTAPNPVGEFTSQQEAKTANLPEREGAMMTNVERRLHKLMLSIQDFDMPTMPMGWHVMSFGSHDSEDGARPNVSIESCREKGYSIVSVQCRDRPRLMFDTVCTIMDMQYVIFHASIDSRGGYAFQEYFIRHIDGRALNTEGEKERVMKCLEAAIERRVCEVHLELCAKNRVGLLSDITRVLRENGLVVVRADIATHEGKAVNNFYVRDISGNDIDMEFIESMKREMEPIGLAVKNEKSLMPSSPDQTPKFSVGDILRSRMERLPHNFVAIK